jgi:alpha-tubulin suppressor-like RCC1 family protein
VFLPHSLIRKLFEKIHFLFGILKANTIGLFSKRDFIIIAFFTLLGAGGVFAAAFITVSTTNSQGAGYVVTTACDENVTVRALTAPDAVTGQLYVATIALSDISQNATTGCGGKIMQIALRINGQMSYASWGIPGASIDGTFYLTSATTSINTYYADTLLSPFQADGLTNVAISQIGVLTANRLVSSGIYSTCALLSTGVVKCWGQNSNGQLGDGTTTQRNSPVTVLGLTTDVTVVETGYFHACVLLSSGAIKCWGQNTYGQLGDGTTTNSTTPVNVSTLSSGVRAISAGLLFNCALLNTGAVKCWGQNTYNQLGDGSTTQRNSPVDVSGLNSGVAAIESGYYHACALLNSGAVKCWGQNIYGQLGDGSLIQRNSPVDVSGLNSGVIAISAGYYHTCALLSTGAVKCWGYNTYGELGDGTTTNSSNPVNVSTLSSGVSAISAGGYQTCALLSTGAVKCWGQNTYGQLGDGSTTQRNSPVDVLGLTSGVTTISAGYIHSCAVLSTGVIKCWGANSSGQLGDGTITTRNSPVDVSGIP